MFRFKQFSVADDHSTQKVCTDSVLLGAWAALPHKGKILDVGTGCGILALQCAQRSQCNVFGIDVHEPSVKQALENFQNSPWADRLFAMCISLQKFESEVPFDMIISNPPYFTNSLKSPHALRNKARHDEQLTLIDFFTHSARLVHPTGRVCICLPLSKYDLALSLAAASGFFLHTVVYVRAQTTHNPYLILLDFRFEAGTPIQKELSIRNSQGLYTKAYREITRDFYLNF